jgi:hypothetical protein
LPGVQADVVVIAARRQKRSAVAHALGDVEAEDIVIETDRPFKVGDLEMHVPDAGLGVDWCRHT